MRTVQEIARAARVRDKSPLWTVTASEPEDAALLLPVVAALTLTSAGRVFLTRDAAVWTLRVLKMVSDLPPAIAWEVGRLYQGRQDSNLDSVDIDALLAFAPWRDPKAWGRYMQAIDKGWLMRPCFSWLFGSYQDMAFRFRLLQI